MKKLFVLSAAFVACSAGVAAQTCNVTFSVAYSDGKSLRVGLTEDQKKFWTSEGAKHFQGICLSATKPDYLILWTEGLSGSELSKVAVDSFNRGRATGETSSTVNTAQTTKGSTTNSGWTDSSALILPSSMVRGDANYWIYDESKDPPPVVHKGSGHKDLEFATVNRPGQSAQASDMASTIPDPAEALKSALKWIKKDRKL